MSKHTKPRSAEHRRKISENNKRMWADPNGRMRQAAARMVGVSRPMTQAGLRAHRDPEVCRGRSERAKAQWQDPAHRRAVALKIAAAREHDTLEITTARHERSSLPGYVWRVKESDFVKIGGTKNLRARYGGWVRTIADVLYEGETEGALAMRYAAARIEGEIYSFARMQEIGLSWA